MDKKTLFDIVREKHDSMESRQRLSDLQKEYGLHDDDAIWSYIGIIEEYPRLMRDIVDTMSKSQSAMADRAEAESKLIASKAVSKIQNEAAEVVRSAILERSEFEKNMGLAQGGLFFLLTLAVSIVLNGVFIGAIRVVEGDRISVLKSLYLLPFGHVFLAGSLTIFLVWAWRWIQGLRGARRDKVV
jgi:hypothetical protein